MEEKRQKFYACEIAHPNSPFTKEHFSNKWMDRKKKATKFKYKILVYYV